MSFLFFRRLTALLDRSSRAFSVEDQVPENSAMDHVNLVTLESQRRTVLSFFAEDPAVPRIDVEVTDDVLADLATLTRVPLRDTS